MVRKTEEVQKLKETEKQFEAYKDRVERDGEKK